MSRAKCCERNRRSPSEGLWSSQFDDAARQPVVREKPVELGPTQRQTKRLSPRESSLRGECDSSAESFEEVFGKR
jgi:hypothetical protein